jgi:hypothetical protein
MDSSQNAAANKQLQVIMFMVTPLCYSIIAPHKYDTITKQKTRTNPEYRSGEGLAERTCTESNINAALSISILVEQHKWTTA